MVGYYFRAALKANNFEDVYHSGGDIAPRSMTMRYQHMSYCASIMKIDSRRKSPTTFRHLIAF